MDADKRIDQLDKMKKMDRAVIDKITINQLDKIQKTDRAVGYHLQTWGLQVVDNLMTEELGFRSSLRGTLYANSKRERNMSLERPHWSC